MSQTVLIVGMDRPEALENCYRRAFLTLDWRVEFFDLAAALRQTTRGGRVGYYLGQFVRFEPWLRKANRQLVIRALELQPDLVLTFTHPQLMPGALAQIKVATHAHLVQIWPDTLANWEAALSANLPVYDLVATYSSRSAPLLQRMGARHVIWLPLAGDPILHARQDCSPAERAAFGADVTFIGGWRQAREAILRQLTDFDLKIWGPEWDRRAKKDRAILQRWQGRPLVGHEFAKAIQCSKINLNIIDPTNYPAANMRFFEIPTAGGLQVSSACPEMDSEFRLGEEIFYYQNVDDLRGLLSHLLHNEQTRNRVSDAGHQLVIEKHTYVHRAKQILTALEGP